MKKFFSLLCLVAILCVAYLAVTQSFPGEKPGKENIEAEAEKLVEQAKDMYTEYGSAAAAQANETLGSMVAQADEKLGDVVEQADEAIEEAVTSAVEGAKKGFFQSIQESIREFFQNLTT